MFSTRKQSEDTPTVHLMKRMRLSGKDLDLNRAGELSETQKRRMLRIYFGRMFLCALLAVGIGIMMFGSIVGIPQQRRMANPWIDMMGIAPFSGVGIAVYAYRRYRHQISSGQVVPFTGIVRKYAHPLWYGHLIRVMNSEGQTERVYNVGYWLCPTFLEGETYTIYSPAFDLERVIAAEHIPSKLKNAS
jgi:hypothetical protein